MKTDPDVSAIHIHDPDRNVIELDAYGANGQEDTSAYSHHP